MIRINLAEIATAQKYSQSKLGRMLDKDIGIVRRMWRNESKVLDIETLNKLCAILNTTPGELIEYTPDPPVKLQIHSVTHGQKAESVVVTATEPKG